MSNTNVIPWILALFAGAVFLSAPLRAQEPGEQKIPQLMEENGCDVCHHRSERRTGPPYEMIASLHAGKDGIIDRLAKKIIKGGMGTWGATPMPGNRDITEKQARAMAEWVMNLGEED